MLYVSRIVLLSYFLKFTANLISSYSVWMYAEQFHAMPAIWCYAVQHYENAHVPAN